jgi:hypothetical protein
MDANLNKDDLEALRAAQPSWRADMLGVRGNPIEFHKEQARINWPSATIEHRTGGVKQGQATAGAPEQKDSVSGT